jgi:imidazolonepropionase-like amidohydrolase
MRLWNVLAVLLVWTLSSGVSSFCSDIALVHARIYPSPTDAPIENGAIVVHAGRILAVGPTSAIKIPRHATVIDCNGLVVTAGF